jgi:hypothetical protein
MAVLRQYSVRSQVIDPAALIRRSLSPTSFDGAGRRPPPAQRLKVFATIDSDPADPRGDGVGHPLPAKQGRRPDPQRLGHLGSRQVLGPAHLEHPPVIPEILVAMDVARHTAPVVPGGKLEHRGAATLTDVRTVDTVKKSRETKSRTWFARNVRQV